MRCTVLLLFVLGCGSDPKPMTVDGAQPDTPDAPPPDVPPIDAPPSVPAPAPGRDIAVASGRLTGGAWSVDVHVGSTTHQAPSSNGGWTVRGGSPIHP